MNVAVVLAGGVGARMGMEVPKQFYQFSGKMVIEYSVDAFELNPCIDEIAIVSNSAYLSRIEEIVRDNGWRKVRKILKGGKERYESSLAAIEAYSGADVNLVIHDAVRPLVSQRIISDVCEALKSYAAVEVAVPAADTIIQVDGDLISSIPDRSRLRRGQSPQGFHIETITEAYKLGRQDPSFKVTDDCGVVVEYLPEIPVRIVPGEECNMKLTYKEDIFLLERFLQLKRDSEQ